MIDKILADVSNNNEPSLIIDADSEEEQDITNLDLLQGL